MHKKQAQILGKMKQEIKINQEMTFSKEIIK